MKVRNRAKADSLNINHLRVSSIFPWVYFLYFLLYSKCMYLSSLYIRRMFFFLGSVELGMQKRTE